MDKTPPLSFNLTQEELYIVLAQLGTQTIPGLENHWQKELNPTNLAMALDIAMRSLIARGLCKPELENNRVRLNPSVIALVGVCAKPEVSITLLCQPSQEPAGQFYFHFAQKLYVAHTIPFTAIHSFLAFQSQPEFQDAFLLAANLPEAQGSNQAAAEITTSGFENAREAAVSGDPQVAKEMLVEAGLETALAKGLAETLAGPDFKLSASRQDSAQNTTQNLSMLGKEKRLWLLTKGTREGMLMAQMISGEDAKKKLQELAGVV